MAEEEARTASGRAERDWIWKLGEDGKSACACYVTLFFVTSSRWGFVAVAESRSLAGSSPDGGTCALQVRQQQELRV